MLAVRARSVVRLAGTIAAEPRKKGSNLLIIECFDPILRTCCQRSLAIGLCVRLWTAAAAYAFCYYVGLQKRDFE